MYSYIFPTSLWFTIITSIIIGVGFIMVMIAWIYQFLLNPKKISNIVKLVIFVLPSIAIIYIFFSLPNVRQIQKVVNHSRVQVTIKDNKIVKSVAINAIPIKYEEIRKTYLAKALITQEDKYLPKINFNPLNLSIRG